VGAEARPAWPALLGVALEAGALVGVYLALPVGSRLWPVGLLLGAVVVVLMAPFLVRQARRIRRSTRPVVDAARAIVLLVTLPVVGFASTYYAIAQHTRGQIDAIETKVDALYFTVTVLSTTGFGDIAPTGQLARAATTAQMVFDVLILAVGVRLVTWAVRNRTPDSPATPPRSSPRRPAPRPSLFPHGADDG